jgi:hypothetical protein
MEGMSISGRVCTSIACSPSIKISLSIVSSQSHLNSSAPRVLQLTVMRRGKWSEVTSISSVTAIIILNSPVEKVWSSVFLHLYIMAAISKL